MTQTIHNVWDNQKGTIAYLVERQWAIEPYAIVRDGLGVLFVSADKNEAIFFGDTLAQAVCDAMNKDAA